MQDIENRDLNDINSHVMVLFEDVLAEPEGVRSSNCVWSLSGKCFGCCKGCFYKFFSCLCGPIVSAIWGCFFGNVAFCHVWCISPCIRSLEMNCIILRRMVKMCMGCCLDPCHESCALIFSAFKRG